MRRPGQPEIEVTGCNPSDERAIAAEFKKCFAMIGEDTPTPTQRLQSLQSLEGVILLISF
jgi:hypothetical protein